MIVITTPTGSIGQQVLERVLAAGQSIRVIARDPSRLPDAIRERVEVIQGSHGDFATVDQAFAGAEAVFWLPPPNFRMENVTASFVDFSRPAADAIRWHRVPRVVSISALGRGTPQAAHAGHVTASLAMDDLLASTGAHLRAVVLPSFMDNLLRQVGPIRNLGLFFSLLDGDLKAPTCATRDIADTAARLLLDPTWTGQAETPVLGPEDLSPNDMAAILSEVLGRPIRYQQITPETQAAQLRERGASEPFITAYLEMLNAKNTGLDHGVTRSPENTTPTTFRQWCEDVLKPAVLG